MKDLERYLGVAYINSFQISIIAETPETFHDPEMTIIIPDTGVERAKTNVEVTYLNNNNIDKAIHQKLRKKVMYETNMLKIYSITVGKTN